MLIGREKELEKIAETVRKKHSLLITGVKGIGKTSFLKYIQKKHSACYVEYSSTKQIIETLAQYLKIPLERSVKSCTIQELLDLSRTFIRKNKPIILVDEFDALSKHGGKLLEKLDDEGALIIGACEQKKNWIFRFRKELALENLGRLDSKILADKWLGKIATDLVLDLIATKSMGNPGKIKEICKDYFTAYNNGDILDKNDVFKFFEDTRPQMPERINILPLWLLFCAGFGFLMLRYFFYSWGDFHEGYLVAMFGYTSLILHRMMTMKKNEK